MLGERNQMQRTAYYIFCLHEMSIKGTSLETGSRLAVASDRRRKLGGNGEGLPMGTGFGGEVIKCSDIDCGDGIY